MVTSPESADTLAYASAATTNVPAPTITIVSGVIDSTHPYYLHPSDYPGMNLVSSAFDGKGYGGWRRAVIIALFAKNKLGFINGTLIIPKVDSAIQQAWGRCNNIVLSWLLNSLSKEIAENVLYSQSAKDLWSDLEDRFGQANGAKLFQLQKELSSVVQVKNLKSHQDERLLQFLMGLNDIFIGVRSNILLSSPLPSIGQAYSLVIQDEKQREIHATPAYLGGSASFIAANQPENFRKFNENRMQKTSFEFKKYLGICSYCKKPGHSIEKCYRIHGFPADFKFAREKRFQGGAQTNKASFSNEENEQGAESASGVQNLTKENVAELLQLIQQVKVGQNSAGTSDVAANVSYAGMTNLFEDLACLIQINDESWTLDSGATEHMSFNKDFFTDLKTLAKPLMVKLPNSYRVQVTHSGTISLLPNLILRNGPSVKSSLEIGKEEGGLYILRSRHTTPVSKSSPKFRSVFIPRRNSVSNHSLCSCFSFSDSIVKEKLWHYRLGHMPFSNMKNVHQFLYPSVPNSPLHVLFILWQGSPNFLFPLVLFLLRKCLN
ncbi:uncharacterized protein LOC142165756 [Nicotiana tabacum]|uniref:Uncharacterized protein LOC142165756 n=1 Tax=Nicotiana tabacum TaxID=4097 RepID=A0AC58S5Q5_TOBAC